MDAQEAIEQKWTVGARKLNGQETTPSKPAGFSLIIWLSLLSTLPMLAVASGLITIVFMHRKMPMKFDPDLQTASEKLQRLDPAYYVNFSATTLVFLASIISTFAAYLSAPLMLLYSYTLASKLGDRASDNLATLPTPAQVGVLVGLIGGGLGSLWRWAEYTLGYKRRRVSSSNSEVQTAASMLISIVTLA
jgi:hypothetical protein